MYLTWTGAFSISSLYSGSKAVIFHWLRKFTPFIRETSLWRDFLAHFAKVALSLDKNSWNEWLCTVLIKYTNYTKVKTDLYSFIYYIHVILWKDAYFSIWCFNIEGFTITQNVSIFCTCCTRKWNITLCSQWQRCRYV